MGHQRNDLPATDQTQLGRSAANANYDLAALAAHGEQTIAKGSKSFAMASLLFRRTMRDDVRMLYAWCRYCDDVIDGQDLGGDAPDATLSQADQANRLDALRHNTMRAIEGTPTGHPAFDGFSLVARKHQMPQRYPMDMLSGFSMDVARRDYKTFDETMDYCYGVAGVVGVMMAIIMGVRSNREDILDRACDLGLAFQLTNICRDIVDDARADRLYLPHDMLIDAGLEPTPQAILDRTNHQRLSNVAADILDQADRYYISATQGIPYLPIRAAAAIAAARNIYRDIGRVIRERGAQAWDQRAYTSKRRKTWLALNGCIAAIPAIILPTHELAQERAGLWARPGRTIS